ncbi:unnamed protein product [Orchesella dallaii]|uniref:Uncharacterized protein n=1 Tax=Orchesella dallaii TaxID=48710 RepID=A0ABP1Q7J6_9HEXA
MNIEVFMELTAPGTFIPNAELEQDRKRSELFEKITILSIFGAIGCGCLIGGHSFIFPTWPVYYLSLISEDLSTLTFLIAYLIQGMLHFVFVVNLWCFLVFGSVIAGIVILHLIFVVTQTFTFNRRRGSQQMQLQKSMFCLHRTGNFISFYRSIDILFSIDIEFAGILLLPLQMIASKMIMISKFVIVRFGRELDGKTLGILGIWAYLGWVIWTSVLTISGIFYGKSDKAIKSWKYVDWGSRKENMRMAKFQKSCKPWSVRYRNVNVIRKLTVLKWNRGLMKGISRALLAF